MAEGEGEPASRRVVFHGRRTAPDMPAEATPEAVAAWLEAVAGDGHHPLLRRSHEAGAAAERELRRWVAEIRERTGGSPSYFGTDSTEAVLRTVAAWLRTKEVGR